MKEVLLPLKDLKTGTKVVSVVSRSIIEELKPEIKNIAGRSARNFLKPTSRFK